MNKVMLKSPYPYFGGKGRIMSEVWERLGDAQTFIDPFLGSNAPMLSRPGWSLSTGDWVDKKPRKEVINDVDGYVTNFWRAIRYAPETVAQWATGPMSELDLHSRNKWLIDNRASVVKHMRENPFFYSAQIAGWWVWGISQMLGESWAISPHHKIPDLGGWGRGIFRLSTRDQLLDYFLNLAIRLRHVSICCGDWRRVLKHNPSEILSGRTIVILDPPYSGMHTKVYDEYDFQLARSVQDWAIHKGENPRYRIVLFRHPGECDMPSGWEVSVCEARGVFGGEAKRVEEAWFSPHCIKG